MRGMDGMITGSGFGAPLGLLSVCRRLTKAAPYVASAIGVIVRADGGDPDERHRLSRGF